jgi:hypothetical protein
MQIIEQLHGKVHLGCLIGQIRLRTISRLPTFLPLPQCRRQSSLLSRPACFKSRVYLLETFVVPRMLFQKTADLWKFGRTLVSSLCGNREDCRRKVYWMPFWNLFQPHRRESVIQQIFLIHRSFYLGEVKQKYVEQQSVEALFHERLREIRLLNLSSLCFVVTSNGFLALAPLSTIPGNHFLDIPCQTTEPLQVI